MENNAERSCISNEQQDLFQPKFEECLNEFNSDFASNNRPNYEVKEESYDEDCVIVDEETNNEPICKVEEKVPLVWNYDPFNYGLQSCSNQVKQGIGLGAVSQSPFVKNEINNFYVPKFESVGEISEAFRLGLAYESEKNAIRNAAVTAAVTNVAPPKRASAFTKSFKLSAELADVVGSDAMPRHEVVRRVWAIIKARELQDPKNKQFAFCDDQLMKVFRVERFRAFGMMKYLKYHFLEPA